MIIVNIISVLYLGFLALFIANFELPPQSLFAAHAANRHYAIGHYDLRNGYLDNMENLHI